LRLGDDISGRVLSALNMIVQERLHFGDALADRK
jgi:hypothetical protein